MIVLSNKRSGERIGELQPHQLQFLRDQLEEESLVDQDYAITPMTLDFFATQGGDPALVALLRQALGPQEEILIQWTEV